MKIIVIDERKCANELDAFLKQHKKSVQLILEVGESKPSISLLEVAAERNHKRLAINKSDSILFVRIEDIKRIESVRNYSQLYLENGKKIMVSKSLVQMEGKLKKHHFIRIHKSHLVNIKYIEKYVKGVGGHLVLTDGTELPVAARKKETLFKELDKL